MEKQIDQDLYEYIIFYNCLVDRTYLASICEYISPNVFKNKDVKSVIGILTDFFKTHDAIPTNTEIRTYLTDDNLKQNFKSVLNKLVDIDKKFNKEELYKNTETYLKERHVFNTLLEAADKLDSKNLDTHKLLSKIEHAVNIDLSTKYGTNLFLDIDTFIAELNRDEPVIPTGWKWLDNKLDGGFLENGRSLYLFMGETNVGKSIFLGNVASNIALQGKKVLLITLEMSEMMYSKRLASSITKIPMSSLRDEQQTLKQLIIETREQRKNAAILIKEFPPSTISPGQLGAFIKKLIQSGFTPDAIVLDYLNLLNSPTGVNSYERVKFIAEKVRALSYEFNCPVISATQVNRSGYNIDEPGLETISESTGLAATADAIFTIWQKDEDKEVGVVNLGVVKNRFGPNFGNTVLRVDYNTLSLKEDDFISGTAEALDFSRSINALVDT
jgi:replicative DNA helicase